MVEVAVVGICFAILWLVQLRALVDCVDDVAYVGQLAPSELTERSCNNRSRFCDLYKLMIRGIAMMCTRPYSVTFIEENANSSTPAEVDGGDAVDLIRMLYSISPSTAVHL